VAVKRLQVGQVVVAGDWPCGELGEPAGGDRRLGMRELVRVA